MEIHMENSCSYEGDGSNSILLPGKKNNKKRSKGVNQENEGLGVNKKPKLSLSKKKKLNKLENTKERAVLLSQSIQNLEKYKISEDAFSLLLPTRNISQVETRREKHARAVQFSKSGLHVSHSHRTLEINDSGSESYESEAESKKTHSERDGDQSNLLRPMPIPFPAHLEPVGGSQRGGSSVSVPSAQQVNCRHETQGDTKSSSATLCDHDPIKPSYLKNGENDNSTEGSGKSSNTRTGAPQTPLGTCTVVHVIRPEEVEDKRKDLPICESEHEIVEAINENSTVIICGETGCGKTTQVPQFLYEAGFGSKKFPSRSGIIGVTQPRRVAVLATARRVAFELGLHLGDEVGFQVRHAKSVGDSCSVKFMTDGILLREVQSDYLLKHYSVIILDEVHEKSLNTDVLIGLLSGIIEHRQAKFEEQQNMLLSNQSINDEDRIYPLKLVLMSATMRVDDYITLFSDPHVIEVKSRQFDVAKVFSKKTDMDYIGRAYKEVISIHRSKPQGGILVFVTGKREVEYLCQKLRKSSRKLLCKAARGNSSDEVTAIPEMNPFKGVTMEDFEELDIQEDSGYLQTDKFSSCDEDMPDESEPEVSYDTEEESEDDGDPGDWKVLETDGNLFSVLGEKQSLATLKANFDALACKTASDLESKGEEIPSIPEDLSENSSCGIQMKGGRVKCWSACPLRVLPLYAMLPVAEQFHVFEEVKEGERLVVVATNVAETSLTIPGIKYVVDTGKEKVKNYNPSSGMETYEVQWISKASADQRAGRAGRTGPGVCYRLYSSAVFNNEFPKFSCAEMSKVPLDSIFLVLKSMSVEVENFPFPTPPEPTSLLKAKRTLEILGALNNDGRLTPLGKSMSYYPVSPRHSRMLLAVIQITRKVDKHVKANLVLGYAVAVAAALSLPDPFLKKLEDSNSNTSGSEQVRRSGLEEEKILDAQEKMGNKKASRARFSNPSSDALTVARALQCFELSESSEDFCKENALHLTTMVEMSKLRKELLELVFYQNANLSADQDIVWDHGTIEDVLHQWRVSSNESPLPVDVEEFLCQAICAGWVDRVARRIRGNPGSLDGNRRVHAVRYEACMVEETVFLNHQSSLVDSAPEFLVYVELVQTKHPYMHLATRVEPIWLIEYARPFCTFSPVADCKPYYDPQNDKTFRWVIPTFGPLWRLPLYSLATDKLDDCVKVFAFALLKGKVLPCLSSVQNYMVASPNIILDRKGAASQRRVGNLLFRLKTRSIYSCGTLRKAWRRNPSELYLEIQDWFKKDFGDFKSLWLRMLAEVKLEPRERFPDIAKRCKVKKGR